MFPSVQQDLKLDESVRCIIARRCPAGRVRPLKAMGGRVSSPIACVAICSTGCADLGNIPLFAHAVRGFPGVSHIRCLTDANRRVQFDT